MIDGLTVEVGVLEPLSTLVLVDVLHLLFHSVPQPIKLDDAIEHPLNRVAVLVVDNLKRVYQLSPELDERLDDLQEFDELPLHGEGEAAPD